MAHYISIPLTQALYQRLSILTQKLNAAEKEKLSKQLGSTVADLSCEILARLFGDLVEKQKQVAQSVEDHQIVKDSQKVLDQVAQTFQKYMPYAVSLFSNERLVPLVNYLEQQIHHKDGQVWMTYSVDDQLMTQMQDWVEKINAGDEAAIAPAFEGLVKIIDAGVTTLIRQPKQLLKFNLVINKTLDGVIKMTTHLGYKRLEHLGTHIGIIRGQNYITHFLKFSQPV